MRRYLLNSTLLHFSILGLFMLISLMRPSTPIWFDGAGFDIYGVGPGRGMGSKDGEKGDGKPPAAALKEEKRGQPVPQPENIKVPDKPAPVRKETRSEEKWKVKDKAESKTKTTPSDTSQAVTRGEKDQKEQTNIVRRGVPEGSKAGSSEFDFSGTGTGAGTGKGIGIGFGPGGGGGGAGMGGYLAAMRRKIWNEWIQYATFGSDKSCVVSMVIQKNGYVHSVKLEQSSGDSLFDTHAQKAIRNAQPLPPLPLNFPNPEQQFRIKFRLLE